LSILSRHVSNLTVLTLRRSRKKEERNSDRTDKEDWKGKRKREEDNNKNVYTRN
jgi:hypothetical protein